MGYGGWAWSPGNISYKEKIRASSPLFYGISGVSVYFFPFFSMPPPCNIHVLTKGRIQSTPHFIFRYMFILDCIGTRSSICDAQTSVLNVINLLYQNMELPSVMKFSNSCVIWYLPLLIWKWLFIRGMYLQRSWGRHTTKLALVCKELPTLPIPFVRKRRTANKLYCTIYLSSVFLIKRNTGVVAF